jgi:predicted transcriptional regulator
METLIQRNFKRLLMFLIAGSRGGPSRADIINLLRKKRLNTNEIAKELELDYKTITHHLRVLEKNNLVKQSSDYGSIVTLTPLFRENIKVFDGIMREFGKK